jgi:hypothetical protein
VTADEAEPIELPVRRSHLRVMFSDGRVQDFIAVRASESREMLEWAWPDKKDRTPDAKNKIVGTVHMGFLEDS